MPKWIPSKALLLVATLVAALSALVINAATAAAAGETVYSNVPGTLPGNFASVGAEAYSFAEFGGQVELAGVKRNKPTIEVVMSAWGCQFGTWYQASCETPTKKKFKGPLTLKLYEVGEKNAVGEQLGEVTKTFAMPYRPSDDHINCPEGGQWYDSAENTCYHGLAFIVKFPPVKVLRVPRKVIVGISYNTSHYGPKPIGDKEPCNTKSAGCYYDALNIGLAEPAEKLLTVGADPTEPYINLSNAGAAEEACGNMELVGKFGPTECNSYWEGDQPLMRIVAR